MARILDAQQLVAGYVPEVDILQGVTVTVDRGELVAVIGPNGAGKSTLVKAIFGLVPVRSGTVVVDGADVTNAAAHELVATGVGYVPQNQNVFPRLTITENLKMGLYLEPEAWDERLAEVVELFPRLRERMTQRAGSLSGGERQMVAMARALMMRPHVLLLDEPSAGLSPSNQMLVFDTVGAIADAGVTVLMVEQNARRALSICHRGYVLDQGTNAYTGTGAELLHDEKVIDLYLGRLGQRR